MVSGEYEESEYAMKSSFAGVLIAFWETGEHSNWVINNEMINENSWILILDFYWMQHMFMGYSVPIKSVIYLNYTILRHRHGA